MFNFWWSAGLVNGIEPHLPALFSQKKWNATFWITFNFWWSAGLVNGLEPHPPPVSSQKNEMLIFWLCSLQMIGRADQWTRTPSATLLQPKKWNAHFCIMFNFWCCPDWSMDSNPIHHPSPANKMKCFFLDYVHYWWSARLVNGLKPYLPPVSSQKNEMPIFWLCSTSDDWPGWSMDSKKNEMLIFGLCSLLMICLADWWTWTPSATPLLQKKWNDQFSITFNFWCLARLVDGLKPHLPPLSTQ